MTIRAINTEWNGYRFRSRLEARWAVFYDMLHIPYQYEPEGFDLDGIRYLPDFWLPKEDAWVEIKPARPDEKEDRKARALAEHGGKPVYVFFGEVWLPGPDNHALYYDHPLFLPHSGAHVWTECPICNQVGICWKGWIGFLACRGCGQDIRKSPNGQDEAVYGENSPRLVRSYRAARQQRFEFIPKNQRRIVEDADGRRTRA